MQQTRGRRLVVRVGAAAWILGAILFFTCQFIAQAAWTTPYSWAANNVSDLGSVHCQLQGDQPRYVCSPLHTVMNIGVIIEGVCIVLGLFFLRALWRHTFLSRAARGLIFIGALAIVLVGFAPADVSENWHVFGAFLLAFLAPAGLFLAGFQMQSTRPAFFRWLATVIGAIGLLATFLFFSHHYLGLGMGGMERFWGFDLPIWTLAMGCYVALALIAGDQLAPSRPVRARAQVKWASMERYLDDA